MGSDSIKLVRGQIGERIAELQARARTLTPTDICARMDAIRAMAAEHGLAALEGLADWSAHHAMLPGHRIATANCLEHIDEALMSESPGDREAILAAIAVRIH